MLQTKAERTMLLIETALDTVVVLQTSTEENQRLHLPQEVNCQEATTGKKLLIEI